LAELFDVLQFVLNNGLFTWRNVCLLCIH